MSIVTHVQILLACLIGRSVHPFFYASIRQSRHYSASDDLQEGGRGDVGSIGSRTTRPT